MLLLPGDAQQHLAELSSRPAGNPTGLGSAVVQRTRIRVGGNKVETDELSAEELAALIHTPAEQGPPDKDYVHPGIQHELRQRILAAGATIPEPEPTEALAEILGSHDLSLEDFILQQSDRAKEAAGSYLKAHGEERGAANLTMLRSLGAMSLLHQKKHFDFQLGSTEPRDENDPLEELVSLAERQRVDLLKAYGLTDEESTAVRHYTNAHTNALMKDSFGETRIGWVHLENALKKLPSTGELGLRHSGFRVPREGEDRNIGWALAEGDIIAHGHEEMDHGQRHFMSVATTYNVHTLAERVGKAGSLLSIQGTSGRFINPFGEQGTMMDGGEVLYPPGVTSQYRGKRGAAPTRIPTHALYEVGRLGHNAPEFFEDNGYRPVRNPLPQSPRATPEEGNFNKPTSTLRQRNAGGKRGNPGGK